MEEERIELSARERERLKVLHEVEQGHLRQIDAAHRLRLSDRQVRRLLGRLRTQWGMAGWCIGCVVVPQIARFPRASSSAVYDGCGSRLTWGSVLRSPPSIWHNTGCG